MIDGLPYSLEPSLVIRHGTVQVEAVVETRLAIKGRADCNCLVLSEIDWKIASDTVVRPDLMIVCGEPKTDFLKFPPVLILEIIAPASRRKEHNVKFELYREQDIRYYLMADYERQIVEVYELIDNVYREVNKNTFLLEPGCEIILDMAALWS